MKFMKLGTRPDIFFTTEAIRYLVITFPMFSPIEE